MLNKKIKRFALGLLVAGSVSVTGCTAQDFANFGGETTEAFLCLFLGCSSGE